MESENSDSNINNKFLKIKSIHDFYLKIKNKDFQNKIEINNNIYIKYLNNPFIIFKEYDNNNDNLKEFFKEINEDLDNSKNIYFPFLDIFPNLVKAYIESNLDDEISIKKQNNDLGINSFYLKIFEKLKYNCFISKTALFPIYDYFKILYDIVVNSKDLKEKDTIFNKFHKLTKLFEIFYEKDEKNKNASSFCLIGGSLNIVFNQDFQLLDGNKIIIKINFLDCDYIDYLNDNSFFMKINEEEIKYKIIKEKIKNKKIENINIIISNEIKIEFNENNCFISHEAKLNIINQITLLEDFFGQICSINILIEKYNQNIEYQFLPISIRNNVIYYIKKNAYVSDKISKIITNIIPKIIINDKNKVRINYINYNDKKFDIINYFGGIIQFLPFHQIFKKIKNINKLEDSNKIGINNYIIDNFINILITLILNRIFISTNKKKIFEKYCYFVYYILLDLDIELNYEIIENCLKDKKNNNIYYYIDLLEMIYFNQKNYLNNEIKNFLDTRDNKDNTDLTFFVFPNKSFKQIYRELMKKVFSYNIFWSKTNILFPKRNNLKNNDENKVIKYKQLNYYTKNFQFPFFYPILEYNNYYPKFSKFKKKELFFKENKRNILEYDFNFKSNENVEKLLNELFSKYDNNKIFVSEKCCEIKNSHHVFGELFFYKNIIKKEKKFEIIFRGQKEDKNEKQNKSNIDSNINNNKNQKNFTCFSSTKSNLCYGSIFACPKRDYNRNIIIKSKDILFLLIRVYYHRLSGIEIYTINKSYFFNFKNTFEINNIKTNKILNEIANNNYFKKIKSKKDNITLGYYNLKYKSYLFPLFEDEINNWEKKICYYNNFDILNLVNIFSNRSFRDIYQYPIFPMLYDLIGLSRELNQHIGLQELCAESIRRKDLFLKTLKSNFSLNDEDDENKEMFIFSIHYSNPAFVLNYLIRLIPYSFLSIEFQGDSFDDPNRLFFSIEKVLMSSLNVKSDLREMIPELYYLIDLFFNKNDILFDKIYNGTNIENVFIKDDEKIESDLLKKENYASYIYNIRKKLEGRHINKWIDLIFGINQKYYILDEKHKYQYYEEHTETKFKTDQDLIKNEFSMDMANFGLIPYQLFNNKFPNVFRKEKDIVYNLNQLNIELFKNEHIQIYSPVQSFLCKGRILLDDNYIKIINPKIQLNKFETYYNAPDKVAQHLYKLSKNDSIFNNLFISVDMEVHQNKENIYTNKMSLTNYYFLGDIFGSVFIYGLKESKKSENENEFEEKKSIINEENEKNINKFGSFEIMSEEEIQELKIKKEKEEFYNLIDFEQKFTKKKYIMELKLIKQLNDHTDEIKYIDFNSRLNILLSYSLDDFINIYLFPILKLINMIDTKSIRVENDKECFDEVVLLSFPFPSIVCHNKKYIYFLSINGDLIKYQKLKEDDKIIFSIDKNLGIIEDKVEIKNSKDNSYFVFNIFCK